MATVLGIDPGTHRLGWGVIQGDSSHPQIISSGCIESPPGTAAAVYLPLIYRSVKKLLQDYSPDLVGLETLLFQRNISTAIPVAEARGVVLLAAAEAGIPVLELAPNTVKAAVAGSGSAGKREMTRMVGLLLRVDTAKMLDDTADALAIAVGALVHRRRL